MLSKIPDSLLNSIKSLNRISEQYRLQIETIRTMNNALTAYNNQMTVISQSISNNLRMYHNIASTVSPLIQVYQNQINITVSNFENIKVWDNFINLAVSAYQNSQEEEFEFEIESIPVSVVKPTIKEIVMFYVEQGINIEIAFRLAISSYIFIKIYPVIFMINSEELVVFLNQFSKYIYKCGSFVLKLSIQKYYEFQDPEEFAKFLVDQGTSALFGFIIGILKQNTI